MNNERITFYENVIEMLREQIRTLNDIIKIYAEKTQDIDIKIDYGFTQNSYNNTGKVGDNHENEVEIKK